MFLTTDDFKQAVKDNVLARIIEADTEIRDTAELTAQAEVEGYLAARYDTGAIFAATGTARHPKVVAVMVDIALYHLYSRTSPDQVPSLRKERYDHALEWLKMVAKQMINPNLPEPADQTKEEVRYGSNPARKAHF